METTFLDAEEWAAKEFSGVQLGDRRRSKRLVQTAQGLAAFPAGVLPASFSNWSELKAAYRLLDNDHVTYEKVMTSHWQRTRDRCREPGDYLLVEDTSELNYWTHPATKGLGRVSADGGHALFIHSTLAFRMEKESDEDFQMTVVGLFYQQRWVRDPVPPARDEPDRSRLARPRESQRWADIFRQIDGPPPGSRWTLVTDRAGDIYEIFEDLPAAGMDFIIRAAKPRRLVQGKDTVLEGAARQQELGRFKMELRSRPGQPARIAELAVRAARVTFRGPWRPGGWRAPMTINVVETREVCPPVGVEPLHWVLLTTWKVGTFNEVVRVINAYRGRWFIEEYHKALKTGTKVEESQLQTRDRLETLLGILAVVAVRLLAMKMWAEHRPRQIPNVHEIGSEVLRILEIKIGAPDEGWTCQTILIAIARLGGFLARKSDGRPGWLTIWRGWKKLMGLAEGFALATERG
jgi:hypothetical protein